MHQLVKVANPVTPSSQLTASQFLPIVSILIQQVSVYPVLPDMLSTQDEQDVILTFLVIQTVPVLSVLMDITYKVINVKIVSFLLIVKHAIQQQEIHAFSAIVDSTLTPAQFVKLAQLIVFSVIHQLFVLLLAMDIISLFKIQEPTQVKYLSVNTHAPLVLTSTVSVFPVLQVFLYKEVSALKITM